MMNLRGRKLTITWTKLQVHDPWARFTPHAQVFVTTWALSQSAPLLGRCISLNLTAWEKGYKKHLYEKCAKMPPLNLKKVELTQIYVYSIYIYIYKHSEKNNTSRERIHIPPPGEVRKIIDSKRPTGKGICDRFPGGCSNSFRNKHQKNKNIPKYRNNNMTSRFFPVTQTWVVYLKWSFQGVMSSDLHPFWVISWGHDWKLASLNFLKLIVPSPNVKMKGRQKGIETATSS